MPLDAPKTIIDLLARHNDWATRTLIETCRPLTETQFTQRFDIGCGSLRDTIQHVIGCMCRWADRIGQRDLRPPLDDDDERTRSIDELLALLEEATTDLHEVVSTVRAEKRIHEKMTVSIQEYPEPFVFTRGTAIVHVYTHGVHHRSQALNMLRQLGVESVPDLDAVDAELLADQ